MVAAIGRDTDGVTLMVEATSALRSALGTEDLWVGAAADADPGLPAGWVELAVDTPVALLFRARWASLTPVDEDGLRTFLSVLSLGLHDVARSVALADARARAESAENFFRDVIDPMPLAVVVRGGLSQRVTFANAAARRLLGRPLAVGSTRDQADVAESGLYRLYDEVLRTGRSLLLSGLEARLGDPPRLVCADVTIVPTRAPDGTIDGTALFAHDVGDQRELQRGSVAAQERQDQLLASLHGIVWEAEPGRSAWTYVSEGAVGLLGYPIERWAEPAFWRTVLHEDDRARVVAESGAERGDHELEYRAYAADGRVVWLHDSVRTVRDAAGRLVTLRGVILDITARREAEIERGRIQRDMVELQKLESLGVMAGGIAHDFNNLLTVILGNASLASMRLPEHSAARSAIDDLIANAHRAADLTRQLLAYSGRAQLTMETLDLGAVLRELRGLISAALPKSATFELDVNPMVPAVDGDRAQLEQVIINLATNAAEALGHGTGEVRIANGFSSLDVDSARALKVTAGAYVVLSVRDDGCGMSEPTRRRIFDPFFTTKETGRGLGLAAVHGIVRTHRGAVDVRSVEGEGTVVSVYLPASTVRAQPRAEPSAELMVGTGLVLIIDDEAAVRSTARAMLEALGYDVIEAADGRTGLLSFDRRRGDIRVVLLDMTMPIMTGEEVYRALRLRDKDVRIVLSTGYSQVDARRRGLMEGIVGFLQKPYTVRQLSETVGRALDKP
ncbi:MAG: PAS domain-containing sensor histidine kinase [Myxococcales bacterium]|nr:PAS domain-containing sensor histidine kinase [Myxococcales bacterium]